MPLPLLHVPHQQHILNRICHSSLPPFPYLLGVFVSLCFAAHFLTLLLALTWQPAGISSPITLAIKNSQNWARRCVQSAEKKRQHTNSPITPSLPFSSFLSPFIFPSHDVSLYVARSFSLTTFLSPHISSPPATPTPLSSLYHPLCHRGNFLPSWQACNCCPLSLSSPLSVSLLLLSLFDTINKQVELAVIVDASAEVPGNE